MVDTDPDKVDQLRFVLAPSPTPASSALIQVSTSGHVTTNSTQSPHHKHPARGPMTPSPGLGQDETLNVFSGVTSLKSDKDKMFVREANIRVGLLEEPALLLAY